MAEKQPKASLTQLLRAYRRGYSGSTTVMLMFYFIKHSPVLLWPLFVGQMIDLVEDRPSDLWWRLAAYTLAIMVIFAQNVPTHMQWVSRLSKMSRGLGSRLRHEASQHVQRLSLLYHERIGVGKLQAKLISDIQNLELAPLRLAEILLAAIMSVVVTTIVVLIKAPLLLIVFALMLPAMLGIHIAFKNRFDEQTRQYREGLEEMSSKLSEMLKMIPVTRAHGLEERAVRDANQTIGTVEVKGHQFDLTVSMFASSGFVTFYTFQALFIAISVVFGVMGKLTVGDITAFSIYFGAVSGALMNCLNVVPELARAQESLSSVDEIITSPDLEHNEGKPHPHAVTGKIRFEHVDYTYPRTNRTTLADITFEATPGTMTAIVGESGSGKSTMLKLMLGFVRPTAGRVLYDGQDGESIDLRHYRRSIAVVTQETLLFSGTVLENIVYASEEPKPEEIHDALVAAHALEFIQALPAGLDTRLGEGGVSLSGGQAQRIAIARALLRDPRVLILDEPTSSLDVEGEAHVRNAIQNAVAGRTVIVVSHALQLSRDADEILVMSDGRIAARGTHEELLRGNSFYRRAVDKTALVG